MMRYEFWLAGTIFTLSLGLKVYIIVLVCSGIGEEPGNKPALVIAHQKQEQKIDPSVDGHSMKLCKRDSNQDRTEDEVF